jgi:thioredoxin-related protein
MALLVLVNWGSNLESALSKATQNKTLIVLYFSGSDWCAPCIQLKKEVLESEPFMKYAEGKLELVRADFPRQKKNQLSNQQLTYNEALAEKYNPKGRFPLTLLLSAEGKVLEEWDGYPKGLNVDKMLERIESHR